MVIKLQTADVYHNKNSIKGDSGQCCSTTYDYDLISISRLYHPVLVFETGANIFLTLYLVGCFYLTLKHKDDASDEMSNAQIKLGQFKQFMKVFSYPLHSNQLIRYCFSPKAPCPWW